MQGMNAPGRGLFSGSIRGGGGIFTLAIEVPDLFVSIEISTER